MKRKDYTSGYLWIMYILTIAAIVAFFTFSCAAPQRIHPADMKYNKQTINPAKSLKAIKIKKCN